MTSLSQARTMGGIGSILVLLAAIPLAGPILAIVGFVLVLIAVKNVSEVVADKSIYNNTIVSTTLAAIGVVLGAVAIFATIFSFVGMPPFSPPHFSGPPGPSMFATPRMFELMSTILTVLAAVWIIYMVSAVFFRKSYNKIASSLNLGIFRTTALLYLIGAALSIILVGFIIVFIAGILQVVAFFSIPEQMPQPTQPSAVP